MFTLQDARKTREKRVSSGRGRRGEGIGPVWRREKGEDVFQRWARDVTHHTARDGAETGECGERKRERQRASDLSEIRDAVLVLPASSDSNLSTFPPSVNPVAKDLVLLTQ